MCSRCDHTCALSQTIVSQKYDDDHVAGLQEEGALRELCLHKNRILSVILQWSGFNPRCELQLDIYVIIDIS